MLRRNASGITSPCSVCNIFLYAEDIYMVRWYQQEVLSQIIVNHVPNGVGNDKNDIPKPG